MKNYLAKEVEYTTQMSLNKEYENEKRRLKRKSKVTQNKETFSLKRYDTLPNHDYYFTEKVVSSKL